MAITMQSRNLETGSVENLIGKFKNGISGLKLQF